MSIQRESADIWKIIAYEAGIESLSTLPLVSTEARAGILLYIKEYILPLLVNIQIPQRAVLFENSATQQFYRLREGKVFNQNGGWLRPIHVIIKDILKNILNVNEEYKNAFTSFKSLLQTGVNVNAQSGQRQIPLLSVCDMLGTLFSIPSLSSSERQKSIAYGRILNLLGLLLNAGANPNVQACPSTPLVTILAQQAFGNEDSKLKVEMITMLLKQGADPDLVPVGDTYGLGKSPRTMAVGPLAELFK